MVFLIRAIHGLLSTFFLACMGSCTTRRSRMLIRRWFRRRRRSILEGAGVALNGGDCPLGGIHRRYGDEKAFFELLLPRERRSCGSRAGRRYSLGIALVLSSSAFDIFRRPVTIPAL
jgi:hypothetical protein